MYYWGSDVVEHDIQLMKLHAKKWYAKLAESIQLIG